MILILWIRPDASHASHSAAVKVYSLWYKRASTSMGIKHICIASCNESLCWCRKWATHHIFSMGPMFAGGNPDCAQSPLALLEC